MATSWSPGGAAAATSASRGCRWTARRSIGDRLDAASARAIAQNLVQSEAISRELGQALLSATGSRALQSASPENRDALRADIFKQILIHSV